MLFCVLIGYIYSHECIHRLIQPKLTPYPKSNYTLDGHKILNRKPIRVLFNYEMFDKDALQCKKAGEYINWSFGNVMCREEDILTEEKRKILIETFESMKDLLSNLINITRRRKAKIVSGKILDINVPVKTYNNIDLLITLAIRPFGSSPINAASFIGSLGEDNRPTVGGIYINPAVIPSNSQNITSLNRDYFMIVLHETFHILGLTDSLYEFWTNRETNDVYGSDIMKISYDDKGKKFYVLQTPILEKWARDKYGEVPNGLPNGVFLEDGGGSGTSFAHPKGSFYYNDIMVGVSLTGQVLSDLTLTMLEATGWYYTNFDYAEHLIWGTGISFQYHPLYEYFPKNYYCNGEAQNSLTIAPDYSGPAICSGMSKVASCSSQTLNKDDAAFCNYEYYYNPYKYSTRGTNNVFDYIQFKVIKERNYCFNPSHQTTKYGEYYGDNSVCAFSTLSKDENIETKAPRCYKMYFKENELYINVDDIEAKCSYENEEIKFASYNGVVYCPDPHTLSRVFQSHNQTFSIPDRYFITKLSRIHLVLIICGSLLFVLIITIIVIAILSRNKNEETDIIRQVLI